MTPEQRAYNQAYYRNNRDHLKQQSNDRYYQISDKPEFKAKVKLARELRHYGVPASVIFQKTEGKCHFCGKKATVVHHLDGDGRTNEEQGIEPGKNVDRLIGSCRACHLNLHRNEISTAQKTRAKGYWSRSHERCVECGRNDRIHAGHGLCVNCMARYRNRKRRGAGV